MIRNVATIARLEAADGAGVRELCGRSTGTTSHSLAEIDHAAGTGTRAHLHRETEETYFILAGDAWLTLDGRRQALSTGDVVLIRPGVVHRIEATRDLTMIVACAPAFDPQDVYWQD